MGNGLNFSGSGYGQEVALVNAVTNIWGIENVGDFLTTREPVGFSGRPLLHGVSDVSMILQHRCPLWSSNRNDKIPCEGGTRYLSFL